MNLVLDLKNYVTYLLEVLIQRVHPGRNGELGGGIPLVAAPHRVVVVARQEDDPGSRTGGGIDKTAQKAEDEGRVCNVADLEGLVVAVGRRGLRPPDERPVVGVADDGGDTRVLAALDARRDGIGKGVRRRETRKVEGGDRGLCLRVARDGLAELMRVGVRLEASRMVKRTVVCG